MLYGGPLVVLQSIYAEYYGLSLATIATVIFVARLFDTVSDPVMGYWSDKYYARNGTRKPFILTGGLVFIAGAYSLFNPLGPVNSFYFMGSILLFYLGYTLLSIPHYAWGNDISHSSKSSTRIYAVRAGFMFFGILFYMFGHLCDFHMWWLVPFNPINFQSKHGGESFSNRKSWKC